MAQSYPNHQPQRSPQSSSFEAAPPLALPPRPPPPHGFGDLAKSLIFPPARPYQSWPSGTQWPAPPFDAHAASFGLQQDFVAFEDGPERFDGEEERLDGEEEEEEEEFEDAAQEVAVSGERQLEDAGAMSNENAGRDLIEDVSLSKSNSEKKLGGDELKKPAHGASSTAPPPLTPSYYENKASELKALLMASMSKRRKSGTSAPNSTEGSSAYNAEVTPRAEPVDAKVAHTSHIESTTTARGKSDHRTASNLSPSSAHHTSITNTDIDALFDEIRQGPAEKPVPALAEHQSVLKHGTKLSAQGRVLTAEDEPTSLHQSFDRRNSSASFASGSTEQGEIREGPETHEFAMRTKKRQRAAEQAAQLAAQQAASAASVRRELAAVAPPGPSTHPAQNTLTHAKQQTSKTMPASTTAPNARGQAYTAAKSGPVKQPFTTNTAVMSRAQGLPAPPLHPLPSKPKIPMVPTTVATSADQASSRSLDLEGVQRRESLRHPLELKTSSVEPSMKLESPGSSRLPAKTVSTSFFDSATNLNSTSNTEWPPNPNASSSHRPLPHLNDSRDRALAREPVVARDGRRAQDLARADAEEARAERTAQAAEYKRQLKESKKDAENEVVGGSTSHQASSGKIVGNQASRGQLVGSQPNGTRITGEQMSGNQTAENQINGSRIHGSHINGSQRSGMQSFGNEIHSKSIHGNHDSGYQIRGRQMSRDALNGNPSNAEISLAAPVAASFFADIDEWLEMTGYHDQEYRAKALARHRKLVQLDQERAALEREAQREHEEHYHSAHTQPMRPSLSDASAVLQSLSLTYPPFAMLPPPSTNDLAYQEAAPAHDMFSRLNHDGSNHTSDSFAATQSNKRPHSPTDAVTWHKVPRLDSQPHHQAAHDQSAHVATVLENRIAHDNGPLTSAITTTTAHSFRPRSRSPDNHHLHQRRQSRSRSRSPPPTVTAALSISSLPPKPQAPFRSSRRDFSPARRAYRSRDMSPEAGEGYDGYGGRGKPYYAPPSRHEYDYEVRSNGSYDDAGPGYRGEGYGGVYDGGGYASGGGGGGGGSGRGSVRRGNQWRKRGYRHG